MNQELINNLLILVLCSFGFLLLYVGYFQIIHLMLKRRIGEEIIICKEIELDPETGLPVFNKLFGTRDIIDDVKQCNFFLRYLGIWFPNTETMTPQKFEKHYFSGHQKITNHFAASLRGVYLEKEELYEESLKFFRLALKLSTNSIDADHYRMCCASIQLKLDQADEAWKYLQQVENPDAPEIADYYREIMGSYYYHLKDFEQAIAYFSKLKCNIVSYEIWLLKAFTLQCAEKYQEALQEYVAINLADVNHEHEEVKLYLGLCAYYVGEVELSINAYRDLPENYYEYFYVKHWEKFLLSTSKEWLVFLNEVINSDPNLKEAYLERAKIFYCSHDNSLRNGQSALNDLNCFEKLNAGHEEEWRWFLDLAKACSYAELGDYNKALQLINSSFSLCPIDEHRRTLRKIELFKKNIPYRDEFYLQRMKYLEQRKAETDKRKISPTNQATL